MMEPVALADDIALSLGDAEEERESDVDAVGEGEKDDDADGLEERVSEGDFDGLRDDEDDHEFVVVDELFADAVIMEPLALADGSVLKVVVAIGEREDDVEGDDDRVAEDDKDALDEREGDAEEELCSDALPDMLGDVEELICVVALREIVLDGLSDEFAVLEVERIELRDSDEDAEGDGDTETVTDMLGDRVDVSEAVLCKDDEAAADSDDEKLNCVVAVRDGRHEALSDALVVSERDGMALRVTVEVTEGEGVAEVTADMLGE